MRNYQQPMTGYNNYQGGNQGFQQNGQIFNLHDYKMIEQNIEKARENKDIYFTDKESYQKELEKELKENKKGASSSFQTKQANGHLFAYQEPSYYQPQSSLQQSSFLQPKAKELAQIQNLNPELQWDQNFIARIKETVDKNTNQNMTNQDLVNSKVQPQFGNHYQAKQKQQQLLQQQQWELQNQALPGQSLIDSFIQNDNLNQLYSTPHVKCAQQNQQNRQFQKNQKNQQIIEEDLNENKAQQGGKGQDMLYQRFLNRNQTANLTNFNAHKGMESRPNFYTKDIYNIVLDYQNPLNFRREIQIHKSRLGYDLLKFVQEDLEKAKIDQQFQGEINIQFFKISNFSQQNQTSNNQQVEGEGEKLIDLARSLTGQISPDDELQVVMKANYCKDLLVQVEKQQEVYQESFPLYPQNIDQRDQLIFTPNIDQLLRTVNNEKDNLENFYQGSSKKNKNVDLESIHGFSVRNQWVELCFEEPVNIKNLVLGDVITLSKRAFNVDFRALRSGLQEKQTIVGKMFMFFKEGELENQYSDLKFQAEIIKYVKTFTQGTGEFLSYDSQLGILKFRFTLHYYD